VATGGFSRNSGTRLRVNVAMIARTWRGWTRREDSDAYLDYVESTGGRAARETPGNRGFYVLRRQDGDRIEFMTMSLWDSLDSIRAFAGDDLEVVFYDEDDRYLVDRERFVTHYEIAGP
jgi:heme-degrading monooxygenase HmoA